MDIKQYIPQIIASILVLAGGGTLQYQASDNVSSQQDYAAYNANIIANLIIDVSDLKREIKELKAD